LLLYTDVCFTENLPPDAALERISGCTSLDHLSYCNYDIARQVTFTFNAAYCSKTYIAFNPPSQQNICIIYTAVFLMLSK
jgi:hypothetical protein